MNSELELLFETFRIMNKYQDQEFEIEVKEEHIRVIEYDFLQARTYSERKEIIFDHREAQKELNDLKLGVF